MSLRQDNLARLGRETFDALVVGAGINGAAAAAALAGNGVRVALIDRGDFAGGTSMHSSNLIWGGIKYLESGDLALVRRLCLSRNRLMAAFPAAVQEIPFLATLPRDARLRPGLLLAGAWLYWLMGNGVTRSPRRLTPGDIARDAPVVDAREALGGVEYADAFLPDGDARFVFGFVRSALDQGATAANYVASLGARRDGGGWHIRAQDLENGRRLTIRARTLINAAGPWVDAHNALTGQRTRHHHVYSKGIHLIVPRLTDQRRVLSFLADDGRPFFAIPLGRCTCIGTTDTRVDTPDVTVSDDDVAFVLDNINRRLALATPLSRRDIIATRCGVRPLAVAASGPGERDFLQLSRAHALDVDPATAHLSIFGGKLTDCLNVGEEVVEAVGRLGVAVSRPRRRWYGEASETVRAAFLEQARRQALDALTPSAAVEPLSARLWRRYGPHAMAMLEAIREDPRQGAPLLQGSDYLRCELAHAHRREMITRLEDLLRRRTRMAQTLRHDSLRHDPGLMTACEQLFGDRAQQCLDDYLAGQAGAESRWPDSGALRRAD